MILGDLKHSCPLFLHISKVPNSLQSLHTAKLEHIIGELKCNMFII